MSRAFHGDSVYRNVPFDEQYTAQILLNLIGSGQVLRSEQGFIAGNIVSAPFNKNFKIASEVAWYSKDGNGDVLRAGFEAWAKASGASVVQFSTLVNEDSKRIGEKLVAQGFYPVEVGYLKEL